MRKILMCVYIRPYESFDWNLVLHGLDEYWINYIVFGVFFCFLV